MNNIFKRICAWALLAAMVLGILPVLPTEAEAMGILPTGYIILSPGQELEMEIQGITNYQTTNLVFEGLGNTLAYIIGYDGSGKVIMEKNVCNDDYMEIFYNALGGYRFECKVYYGQLKISYNGANHGSEGGDPIGTLYEFGKKVDWLIKPTMNEVYLTVGDTAVLGISEVADGYSARAEYFTNQYSSIIAGIDSETGVITANSPGTTTVYMEVLFWLTSTDYFYFSVPCTVHVVEDYSLEASWAKYYAEPDHAYFNIVAYDEQDNRVGGFDITLGDKTYNTGESGSILIPLPEGFSDSVRITKEGFVPYVLTNERLQVSNVITMTPDRDGAPVLQGVWIRRDGDSEYRNVKLQALQITEGDSAGYSIHYDAFWNGHFCDTVYLQQGNVVLPLTSQGDSISLGKNFTSDGGPVLIHALTNDGYSLTAPLLITVVSEVSHIQLDFGEAVSETVEESVNGLGGQRVSYDLYRTIPIKFAVNSDGTARGIVGLKFSGASPEGSDLWSLYDEVGQIIREMNAADARGDTATSNTLWKKLNKTVEDRNAYIDPGAGSFGFKCSASILGYVDGKMEGNQLNITEVGLIGVFSVSATGYKPIYIGYIPGRWILTFKDEAQLLIGGLADGSNGKLKLLVPDFNNTITVSGELNAGAYGIAEALANLTGKVKFDYPTESHDFSDGTWTLDVNFHLGARLFNAEVAKLPEWRPVKNHQIYPRQTEASEASHSAPVLLSEPQPEIQVPGTSGLVQVQTLAADTLSDPMPRLIRLENQDVLVWLDAAEGRDGADASCLYYAVRDRQTGLWSDRTAVADDGFADFYPQLIQSGDRLFLTWQKADGSLTGAEDLQQLLTGLDICVAEFAPAAGTFGNVQKIHAPNDAYDSLPQVQLQNEQLTVTWVSSTLAETVTSRLLRCTQGADGTWTEESLCTLTEIPDGLAWGPDDSLYYTANGILYRVENETSVAVTAPEVNARSPKFREGTLYWLEDDVVTDGTVRIPAAATAGDFELLVSPNGSRKALVCYTHTEKGRQLGASFFGFDRWSDCIPLTDETDTLPGGLTGYLENNGSLTIVSGWLSTDSATGQQRADLKLLSLEPKTDLTLTGAEYLGTSLVPGGNLKTEVFLTNSGTEAVDSVLLTASEGETTLGSSSVSVKLLPGESTAAQLVIPLGSTCPETITFSALPVGKTDAQSGDNTTVLELRTSDISAEQLTLDTLPDGTVQAAAMVINRGQTNMTGLTAVFTRNGPDGDVLSTVDAGSVDAGALSLLTCSLSGLSEGDLVYMSLRSEAEENYISNNTVFALVRPVIRETTTVRHNSELKDQELKLDTDYVFSIAPDDEGTVSGLFTPEISGFYLVKLDALHQESGYAYSSVYTAEDQYVETRNLLEEESWEDGWSFRQIRGAWLEAGTTYRIQAHGGEGIAITLRLEEGPVPEAMQIEDFRISMGEQLMWGFNILNKELVSFQPELSWDLLTFVSSDPDVVTVDEFGYVTPLSPGSAVITATGVHSGLQTTFTVTVTAAEEGTPLTMGQQTIPEEELSLHSFTAPETGYYHFGLSADLSFYLLRDGEYQFFSSDGCTALLLRAGETAPCFFTSPGELTVRKAEPQEISLDDYEECDCDDCLQVLLYRFRPEKDVPVQVIFSGEYCHLRVYDEDYQLLCSEYRGLYGSDSITEVFRKGETYYLAVEHSSPAALELEEVSMELNYYSPVFVGDTVVLSPWISTGQDSSELELVWTTSDASVATVSPDGTVTFQKEGPVTISVSAMEGLLTAEHTFHVIAAGTLTLNTLYKDTLSTDVNAARLVFTPEHSGNYLYTIRQTAHTQNYWFYEYNFTDAEDNYLDLLGCDYVTGGVNAGVHLEAGQPCYLTVYFSAEEPDATMDLAVLVTSADCSQSGHTEGTLYGYDPGCTEPGLTNGVICIACGEILTPQEEIPALGHDFVDGECTRCGEEDPEAPTDPVEPENPGQVIRIAGADRIGTSLQLADQLKEVLGVEKFDSVIVASALNFPDALTGSYLAAVKNAPILLTYEAAHSQIRTYIQENLAPGGMVYILGGESAVSASFANGLNDFTIQRVAGSDRFGTNLAIMREAGVTADQPVLIATALNFADSLSASAAGLPMVLVYGSLREDQKEFLATTSKEFIIIGGTSAVSEELEAELRAIGNVSRLAGAGRYQTSVMVAQKFVQNPDAVVLAYARNFPDGLCGGPLAYALNAPLILTDNYDPATADAYVEGITDGVVVGGSSLISDDSARAIFDLAANAPITAK